MGLVINLREEITHMKTSYFFCLGMAAVLAGCGGPAKAPELADAAKPSRTVSVRLHAANKLNTDARGQSLALVARLYKLRQSAAFEAAPYTAFLSPQAEQAAFGADLLEVKEITLVPGQKYEVMEKVSREAGYLGIVALFHKPAPQRWRLAYSAAEAEPAGVTVGVYACSMASGAGARARTPSVPLPDAVRCQ
jgi:type VI secretion system protein VasD